MDNRRRVFTSRSMALLVALGLVGTACGGGSDAGAPATLSGPDEAAMAIIDEASELLEEGALEEGLKLLDGVIADHEGDAESLTLNRAQVGRGAVLALLNRDEEAVAAFDEVITQIGLTSDPARAVLAIDAVSQKLRQVDGPEEWIAGYEGYRTLIDHYRESEASDVMVTMVWTMIGYADNLELAGRLADALAVYDSIAEQYGQLTDADLQLPVSSTYTYAADNLRAQGRDEEALFFLQQAIDAAENTADDDMALLGSQAWLDMARLLNELGATVEALETYEAHQVRYEGREEIGHRRLVLTGLFQSGLLLQDLGRDNEARTVYLDVLSQVEVPSSDATLASLAGIAEHQLGILARG